MSQMGPQPQPGIEAIALYESGKAPGAGHPHPVKLSANENPYGPSPAAKAAYAAAAGDLHRYPGTDHRALREALAARHGLNAGQILCGNGSDELLHLIAQAYAGAGDEVLYPEHGFLIYPIVARGAGASPVPVPEKDRRVDVAALLAAVTDRTKILFLANPANPTGSYLPRAELQRLVEGLPPRVLLVLDGAYAEYVDGYDGGAEFVAGRENVVMTRSFSKAYGLGGLRLGWAYGPQAVVDNLNRLRGPFNLSAAQQAAGIAALGDLAHLTHTVKETQRLRGQLAAGLAALGIPSDPSAANFILARFASGEEAAAADAALAAEGLIVRRVVAYGLPAALRITIGDESACDRVLAALAAFKKGLK